MKSPAPIRLRLLGRLALSRHDEPIRLSTRKAGALIAFVAMSPEQVATREQLATLLWGNCTDQQARQSLRQALALLRKDLGAADFLSTDTAVVRLQGGLWSVDARDFEALSKSSDPHDLDRAARLFGGEFLSGLNIEEEGFEEWVREQRQRMQLAAARLCDTFAARPDLVIDPAQALGVAEQLLAIDPLREDWQRIALTLYARYRGRNEALAQAEAFADVLQRELGSGPERETQDLVERIRAGEIAAASPALRPPVRQNEPTGEAGRVVAARPHRARWRAMAAALVAVALAAGGMFALASRHAPVDAPVPLAAPAAPTPTQADDWRSPSPAVTARSAQMPKSIVPIAVLPFSALADTGRSAQLIADMMTDDLINVLSRVPSFRVISRRTTSRYQGIDVATVGAELQVKYVLEGSIRAQDGSLRVNLQLIDPATRLPLWSGRVDRPDADRLAVRDEIVAGIARQLQIEIIPIEGERRSADQSADADAYLGWSAMQSGFTQTSMDHYRRAEAHFRKALERDPQHLAARVGLGAVHANVGAQRLDAEPLEHLRKAREILGEIVQHHPDHATALFQLAIATQSTPGPGQITQGLALFDRVVDLNPSNAGAHAHIGHGLARTGQPEKGIEHIRYAMRLSPKDPSLAFWHEFIGNAQLELAQYGEAAESFRASASLAPDYPRPWAGLVATYTLAGDTAATKAPLDKLKALAQGADAAALVERFGRNGKSRLHAGLRLALAPAADPSPSAHGSAMPAPDPLRTSAPPAGHGAAATDDWQSPAQRAGTKPGKSGALQKGVIPIVILPFAAAGADEATQLVADMMTDDLSNALSRAAVFRVISRQTARSYAGARPDPATLRKELGVGYALTATVTSHDGALDVAVELIDTVSAQGVWSASFRRSGMDRLLLQDEIIIGLGRELSVEVTRAEGARATASPDVPALIFRGWSALFDTGASGLPALTAAQTHFIQALERDPGNARASIGLAAYHVLMAIQLYAADPAPHLAQAESILQPILDRNPTASDAAHFMGMVNLARRRIDDARQWFERAIEQNPSQAVAYAQLGRILVGRGRAAEGLEHIRYAMRLSPRDPSMAYWFGFAGAAELELGHDAKAIDYLNRALVLHPTQPRNLLVLVAAHAMAGNRHEARETLARVQQALPHLTNEKLIEKFFGATISGWPRLREGLRRASAPAADSWQSPPLPSRRERAEVGKPVTALAVLPFTTYGESAGSLQQTADILTEDLTSSLSRVAMLRVISRQTMRGYLGQKIDTAAIGAELGVSYVIEGNVRTHGDKLRVNVELIDPATRLPVWSTRIERDGTDLNQLRDEIVGRLARELHFEVYQAQVKRGATDPGFKELIYTGWTAILSHGSEGLDALKRAEAAFLQADAREPGNPASRFGLGAYHTLVGSLQLLPDWRGHLGKAEHLLRQNIKEQPEVAGQHFYLSIVLRMRGSLEPALEALQRCIELAPSMAPCHAHIGHTLVQMNRAEQGLPHIDYALRLSPRDPSRPHWLRFAGEAEIEMGHFDRATALLRQSYAVNPRYPFLLRSLAAASALSGNMDESRKYIAELGTVAPHLSIERYLHRPAPMRAAQPELDRGLRMALAPRM